MADTITVRTDEETEHALDVLTYDGSSRSAAIRQAVLDAARRRERAAELRQAVLRMDLGEPDGVNVAEELARQPAMRAQVETLLGVVRDAGISIGAAHAVSARLLLQQGKLRPAREAADRAIALSPDSADGYYGRGRVRLERGDPQASLHHHGQHCASDTSRFSAWNATLRGCRIFVPA